MNNLRTDALTVEARDVASRRNVTMAIPSMPAARGAPFKVHRPKILAFSVSEDAEAFNDEFWEGVEGHAQRIVSSHAV